MLILGIETSCDETAIAILQNKNGRLSILSNIVSSQIKLHAAWGGVVPNLAAREHLKNIIPVLKSALKEANKKMADIDLISVTHGPGLIPALLIGTNFAKTLSYIYQKPLLGIHHIEGHIYANFIENKISVSTKLQIANLKQDTRYKIQNTMPQFPILSLVVSGGHTQLILMTDHFKYEVIGETQDDAAGEAFDKVARILGLGYPGGPSIAAQAANYELRIKNYESSCDDLISNDEKLFKGNIKKPIFPRPMLHSHDFNFSFSGLKTSVLYYVKNYRKENNLAENSKLPLKFVRETAYEFQEAATDILVIKTIQAAQKYNPKTIFIAGGVSANSNLREKMGQAICEKVPHINYQPQSAAYSTDNAAMIAIAANYRWKKMTAVKKKQALKNWRTLQANAQLKI
ncbi:MAG: putative tRNA threonylcarbamoyladenosine biosynthesis protein Gcp [Candidatus Moranbacteria bacterium GW2011_GWE1_35_17]|nr:MAG: putative tRNA threonylcarbamoyladenosine biosynthesis protein Gcp [Candidatus Moranbacteria bacterium GW2011_GWE1_35_17]KKP82950.1 MAG: putative tRNA threonylcarbamoyladenosine biosynthesis protein Gcp [Candidatus Moranbacteria bacterium GW2011_GWF1_35_5]